jgi:hypothetical protein
MSAGSRAVGAIIPVTVVVNKAGDMLSCGVGEVNGTKGCRVVEGTPPSGNDTFKYGGWAQACNPDEVLISGGARCSNPKTVEAQPVLQISAPFMQNRWVADCYTSTSDDAEVTVYAYCCPN